MEWPVDPAVYAERPAAEAPRGPIPQGGPGSKARFRRGFRAHPRVYSPPSARRAAGRLW